MNPTADTLSRLSQYRIAAEDYQRDYNANPQLAELSPGELTEHYERQDPPVHRRRGKP
jgi:hypothetical protein